MPAGVVTFLFTDIEGSTGYWLNQPEAMRAVIQNHDEVVTGAIENNAGQVLKERGEGDSFFAVFSRASDAVAAALAIQRGLQAQTSPDELRLKVRIAIHTGEAADDYRSLDVNRCARLRSVGYGGQVLMTAATEALVHEHLPKQATLLDLGLHRLRDLREPERVFQLQHPELTAGFPRLRSLDAYGHNLPVQLTSFVGREMEQETVKRLMAEHRLVTMTGSGGCGKTRLSLQIAADCVDSYRDGVWFVDLTPLSDPALVLQAIATVVSVKEDQGGKPLLETLSDSLREKQMLLVLDNCEHLIDSCARVAESLLQRAAGLRILATSREALNIAGEQAWRVPSLSMPDPSRMSSPDQLQPFDAVRLFVDRVRAARPDFTMNQKSAPTVAQICRRLDGIPLAMELAAARAKLLGLEEIQRRLEGSFQLLTGGRRTALTRHQTLRAAVDWSYDLLAQPEQILLRRLSVFAGGFGLDDAESVCAGTGLAKDQVLDLLSQLVDKSLVVPESSVDDALPYRLLETMRQYGQEKLRQAGESEELAEAHLNYYLTLSEEAYLNRFDQFSAWLKRLEAEHDNLRGALRTARTKEDQRELQLAGALAWFWQAHSQMTEGREHLRAALQRRSAGDRVLARAVVGAGYLAVWQADIKSAWPYLEEGLKSWRQIGDPLETALTLEAMGWAHFMEGNDPDARRRFEENLDLQREIGNEQLINRAILGVCQVLVSQGEVDQVPALADEALKLALKQGDHQAEKDAHHYMGDCALIRGDCPAAEQHYLNSLTAALKYGDSFMQSVEMQGMAMAAAGCSKASRALRLGGAAEKEWEVLGVNLHVPFWDALMAKYFGQARDQLSPPPAAGAWEEGRQMEFKRAVDYALDLNSE
jgi:predicted ATPase/class 3 adenylate cyclase